LSKEYEAFNIALEKVLSVSHDEIKRREAEEKAKKELAPRRRKTKKKSSAWGRALRKGG
jgi:hypothetical protein